MKLRSILALALALTSAPALAQVNPGTQPLSIAKGGTGAGTASGARTNLGLGTSAAVSFGTLTVNGCTLINAFCFGGAGQIISTNTAAFSVGQTAVNPTFNVNTSSGTAATGFGIAGTTAGGGAALSVISSGTNENGTVDAKGNGTLCFGCTSTGAITLNRVVSLGAGLSAPLASGSGGSGVNNGSFTSTLGGNFSTAAAVTHAGAFGSTITVTGITNSTLPAGTHTLAALDVVQNWAGVNTFGDGGLLIGGVTSGTLQVRAAAAAGTSVVRFPAGSIDFSATGGAGQYVKQTSPGGALTVAAVAAGDLPLATNAAIGGMRGDTSTISCVAGVCSSVGSAATAVTMGTTTATGGTNGNIVAVTSTGCSGTTPCLTQAPLTNFLGGLVLSNDGVTPNTILDVAAGSAMDSSNASLITIGAFTKKTSGAWTVGTNQNGMGNGLTIVASTWYHVCLTPNGGTADIWFDTSAVCANKPAGVSGALFRRIGAFKTDGAANILAFVQHGDNFIPAVAVSELSTTTPATTLTALSLVGVPPGISTTALLRGAINATAASADALIAGGDETSVLDTPSGNRTVEVNVANTANGYQAPAITNASNQIKYQASSATWNLFTINTSGYIDTRGK